MSSTAQTQDRFTGAWLVSEYVYNPDGSFAGVIRQRRRVLPGPGGLLRVEQVCSPDPALDGHPMAAFRGEWVFDLEISGRLRRYHGPDVRGAGLLWDDGMMTGRGLWPTFGHNFTSFALMVEPGRQITGGRFYNASAMIASIAGVAVPEIAGREDDWPVLETAAALEIAPTWAGTLHAYRLSDGMTLGLREIVRTLSHEDGSEHWTEADRRLRFSPDGPRLRIDGDLYGIGKRFGPLLDYTLVDGAHSVEVSEILDPAGPVLAQMAQVWREGAPVSAAFALLRPIPSSERETP